MKNAYFHRTQLLLGVENINKISNTSVILFGVGGVGSWCAESLIRSGIENLTIVDSDRVCATNINRQLQATSSTIGNVKVNELKKRLVDINPDAEITALQKIYSPGNSDSFNLSSFGYIIDAIDSLSNKIHLIESALKTEATFISSMGAALKIDPTKIKVDSIWKTKGCPLARKVRNALRKRGVKSDFKCIYSEELIPLKNESSNCGTENCICPKSSNTPGDPNLASHEWCSQKAQINGSISHITAIFGFMIAGLIIESIVKDK